MTRWRSMAVVVAGLLLVAGCGGGSDEPRATATTTASPEPPVVRTIDDLAAALPERGQVPGAAKQLDACGADDECPDAAVSVTYGLEPSLSDAEVKRQYDVYILPEVATVAATAWKDADAAAAGLAKARDGELVGTYSTKGKETSDTGYTFGAKGKATIEDVTVAGWSGYLNRREEVLTSPEGGSDTPPLAVTVVHVSDGSSTVKVTVQVLAGGATAASSESAARQLAEDYIARLE